MNNIDNYKLAFIHGHSDDKVKMQEGKIEMYGSNEKDSWHVLYLLEYAKEKYPDIEMFKSLNDRYAPESVGYLYTVLGDIIFFNMTSNEEKYGKIGMLMLPNQITESQKEGLYDFVSTIDDYSIQIIYDLKLEDGILDGQEIRSFENQKPTQLLDLYFIKNNSKAIKK